MAAGKNALSCLAWRLFSEEWLLTLAATDEASNRALGEHACMRVCR